MKIDFAYIAGYLDGDGCFYLGKYIQKPKMITVYEYSIQVLSVEIENLKILQQFGGVIREKETRENQKTPYCWTIKTLDCFNLAKNVFPYLVDKPIQCEFFISYIESINFNSFSAIQEQKIKHREVCIKENRRNKVSDFVTKENIESIKYTKPSITPTEANFAYLAGLIEAEGTFRIKSWKPKNKPNKVYNISLEIGNTRFPIFPWLMDRFGGNISFTHPKRNKKAVAIWSLQSDALFKIIPILYQYLRTRKKLVCEKLIEFSETILTNGGDRHSSEFKDRMNAIIDKREKLIQEVHILNKKGA